MSGPSVKVPADWLDSDHVEQLGAEAVMLMLSSLAYSARQLSEGVVPARALRKLWPVGDLTAVVERLRAAGEVEDLDDDGLLFVNWRTFLLTADEVDRIKEQNRIRDERRRRHNKGDHSMCSARYCGFATSRESHVSPRVSHADPILTDPVLSDPTVGRREDRRRSQGDRPGGAGAPPVAAEVETTPLPPPPLPDDLTNASLTIQAFISAERRFGAGHDWRAGPPNCCKAPRTNPIHDAEMRQLIATRADLSEYVAFWRHQGAA